VPPHLEEEPDDPDEPEQPATPGDGAVAPASPIPSVGMPARDGWELAEVIDGGEKRVLLMRRPKRSSREARRVGFAPPSHN
jgi:hypothetical protein